MPFDHTRPGLLESGPRREDDLKRAFGEQSGQDHYVHDDQAYFIWPAQLTSGLVGTGTGADADGRESGGGPARRSHPFSATPLRPALRETAVRDRGSRNMRCAA
jgi:hypothetical protein